jgi:hypothetical protein
MCSAIPAALEPRHCTFAMQKVVGSSPIIRSSQARWKQRVSFDPKPRRPMRDSARGNEMATLRP